MAVYISKQAHYLLGAGDKVGESSRGMHVFLKEIDDMVNKKIGHEIF